MAAIHAVAQERDPPGEGGRVVGGRRLAEDGSPYRREKDQSPDVMP